MTMILTLAKEVGLLLKAQQLTLVTAESCTGGGLSYALTSIPGSSLWFDRAYVTYTEQAKIEMLGLSAALIKEHGVVSEAVALAMANQAMALSRASWGIAITGIAGPDGGTEQCPVGTIWIAWANQKKFQHIEKYRFTGDRLANRELAIENALSRLKKFLEPAKK